MTAEQHNLHCDLSFCWGENVKCSENSLLPLWKVFQQRFLYRRTREFQNKKLSMYCVFILTFLWWLICGWLQLCIMYMELVKSSGHSDLRDKISFTYKTHLLRFILAALSSRILNEITNILHVIVHLSEGTFLYIGWGQCTILYHNQLFPPFVSLFQWAVRRLCTSVLTRHLY